MVVTSSRSVDEYVHGYLDCGVEYAFDPLPRRKTAAICFRMLTGMSEDPPELTGISSIVEHTLSKGTERYGGQALADALDTLGAEWGGQSGRQSMLLRLVCLPEFMDDVVELAAEMIRRPTFPDEACKVAVQLAQEDLRHMEDDPNDLLRYDVQRLTLGPVLGRNPGGEADTLPKITPKKVREHWRKTYCAGRLQASIAGPVDVERLQAKLESCFAGFGEREPAGRDDADYVFTPGRHHREKDLKQQYIGLTLPGAAKGTREYYVECVLMGVLSGGMSGRLFTEIREKQGLVYWVGAWHEQPRGRGVVHLGASSTPDNCEKAYRTLLRELKRVGADLTDEETQRARNSLIAHLETEDDLTRARAGGLSDDLFHFSRPVGSARKIDELRTITTEEVEACAKRLPLNQVCMATVGPLELTA